MEQKRSSMALAMIQAVIVGVGTMLGIWMIRDHSWTSAGLAFGSAAYMLPFAIASAVRA